MQLCSWGLSGFGDVGQGQQFSRRCARQVACLWHHILAFFAFLLLCNSPVPLHMCNSPVQLGLCAGGGGHQTLQGQLLHQAGAGQAGRRRRGRG